MNTKHLLILYFFLGIMSCSGNSSKLNNSGEINLEGTIKNDESKGKTDLNTLGTNTCLLDYQTKYDQLLNESDVLTVTGFSKDVMKVKYNKALQNTENHSYIYKFTNRRIQTVPGINQKLEMPDLVIISSIKVISLSAFESTYKAISDEDMHAAKDVLKDAVEGNSGNKDAEAALEKAREKDVSKEQIKKTGSEIMDVMKEVSKGYRIVNGLGDAARWNIVSNELIVLQNGVQFIIRSDVSADNEKNKSVAIDLAKIIINKCN